MWAGRQAGRQTPPREMNGAAERSPARLAVYAAQRSASWTRRASIGVPESRHDATRGEREHVSGKRGRKMGSRYVSCGHVRGLMGVTRAGHDSSRVGAAEIPAPLPLPLAGCCCRDGSRTRRSTVMWIRGFLDGRWGCGIGSCFWTSYCRVRGKCGYGVMAERSKLSDGGRVLYMDGRSIALPF